MVVKKIQNLKYKMQKWNSKSIRRPHDLVVTDRAFFAARFDLPRM